MCINASTPAKMMPAASMQQTAFILWYVRRTNMTSPAVFSLYGTDLEYWKGKEGSTVSQFLITRFGNNNLDSEFHFSATQIIVIIRGIYRAQDHARATTSALCRQLSKQLNRNVFSRVMKVSTETSVDHNASGRLFHVDGLEMANSCHHRMYLCGTDSWHRLADLGWKPSCKFSPLIEMLEVRHCQRRWVFRDAVYDLHCCLVDIQASDWASVKLVCHTGHHIPILAWWQSHWSSRDCLLAQQLASSARHNLLYGVPQKLSALLLLLLSARQNIILRRPSHV